jgi:hypothetical protein
MVGWGRVGRLEVKSFVEMMAGSRLLGIHTLFVVIL